MRMLKLALLALIAACATTAHAQAPPVVFEDVNNNGVWDAGVDKDVTQVIVTQREFATPNSVVITAPLKPIDPKFKQTGAGGCAYIRAGKDITVLGSILCPYYDGTVVLLADGKITVGDRVLLVGRNRVNINALGDVTIGNSVTMTSGGGSANQGVLAIGGIGKVTIGTAFKAGALKDFYVEARGGGIAMGAGASVSSTKATVRFMASGDIAIDGASLKGADVDVTSFTGSVAFRNGMASVPKTGSIGVYSYKKTVDVTGTKFVGPVDLWPAAVMVKK